MTNYEVRNNNRAYRLQSPLFVLSALRHSSTFIILFNTTPDIVPHWYKNFLITTDLWQFNATFSEDSNVWEKTLVKSGVCKFITLSITEGWHILKIKFMAIHQTRHSLLTLFILEWNLLTRGWTGRIDGTLWTKNIGSSAGMSSSEFPLWGRGNLLNLVWLILNFCYHIGA